MTKIDDATIRFAHRLADASGEVIRPYFRQRIDVIDKGKIMEGAQVFDPVTAADRGAEEALRRIITAERPEDGILGEEFGELAGHSGFRWVLDPVDGTRAFINGRHEWGSLIALEKDGAPALGIIDQPVLRERFIGVNGIAELHAGGSVERLRVRPCADISEAILCATHPYAYFDAGERAAFRKLAQSVRMSRFGGDCYLFGILAMGFADLVVESHLHRWDVAALIPVVKGAGGIITNWQGRDCSDGGQVVAAGDARVHKAALHILNDRHAD